MGTTDHLGEGSSQQEVGNDIQHLRIVTDYPERVTNGPEPRWLSYAVIYLLASKKKSLQTSGCGSSGYPLRLPLSG